MASDNTLMLKLLLFAAEDYAEDFATKQFRDTVKEACKRLGIEYSHSGLILMERVESRLNEKNAVLQDSTATVGNAAAVREALVKIARLVDTYWTHDAPIVEHEFSEIKSIAKAALSAPARNCDLPLVVDGPADNNADKAWLVFKRHNPDAYFDVSGLLRCIDWLLAPAAERKGEGDGV